jgi:putative transcriptional regulator
MITESTITIAIDPILLKHGKSFYWLSKETGISYTTLWRLKKGRALGINFATLLKLCGALECRPGDLITITETPKERTGTGRRSKGGKSGRKSSGREQVL